MKFIIAFKAEPLQLKFLNWILDRTDIDRNAMMEAIKNKDKDFTDAITRFVEFQGEVKKYATKITNMTSIFTVGNSSNIFLDCIYEQCTNDDDSFKYVFGDDKDETRCKNHFNKALDSLYDAFKNSMEFSNEGKFKKRAQEVFNGFKGKKTKLEKLVSDMDKIFVDNNKNRDEENDERTFEEKEKDSWETLEKNEVFTRGMWHVYQVDEYEDMRNVAADCSEWCVARRDSGRGYFYNTYRPPYYLFCKGKRNPTILMHIDSQQFKGLDDQKFSADRPTSYEAIEIGREFLKKQGKLDSAYRESEDFSVFNEDEENKLDFNKVTFTSNQIMLNSASSEDMNRIYEMTDNPKIISSIVEHTGDIELMMKILDDAGNNYCEYADIFLGRGNLIEKFGAENAYTLYCRIIDETKSLGYDDTYERAFHSVSQNSNKEIIQKIFGKYQIDFAKYFKKNKSFISKSMVECIIDDRDLILKVYPFLSSEFTNMVIDKYHDDYDVMILKIKKVENGFTLNENNLSYLVDLTNNPRIIEELIDCSFFNNDDNTYYTWYTYHIIEIWNAVCKNINRVQIDEQKKEQFLKKISAYVMAGGKVDNETAKTLMDVSPDKKMEFNIFKKHMASYEALCEYFDKHIDDMKYEGGEKGDWDFFCLFARSLYQNDDRLYKLYEKTNYDFSIIINQTTYFPLTKQYILDIRQCVARYSSFTYQQCQNMFVRLKKTNGNWIDNEESPKAAFEIINKCTDKNAIADYMLGKTFDSDFAKEIMMNYQVNTETVIRGMATLNIKSDEKFIEKYCNKLINECRQGNRKSHMILYGLINDSIAVPENIIKEITELEDNGDIEKTSLVTIAKISELVNGHVEDKDKFIEDFCKEYSNENQISKFLIDCIKMGDYFYHALWNVLGFGFLDIDKKTRIMDSMFYQDFQGFINIGKFIPWCLENETHYLCRDILKTKNATEEQARDAFNILNEKYDYFNDTLYARDSSITTQKIIFEKEKNGELKSSPEWNLSNMVRKNSTKEEISLAFEIIKYRVEEENEDIDEYSYLLAYILDNDNCTKKLADDVISLIDDWDYFIERNGISGLYKWVGNDVFSNTDTINNYRNYSDAANVANTEEELNKIFSLCADLCVNYEDDYDEDEDDYDEDDYDENYVIDNILKNKHCGINLLIKIVTYYDEKGKKEKCNEKLYNYINDHIEMSSEDIDVIIEKCNSILSSSVSLVDDFLQCVNMTEEQLMEIFKKYKTIGFKRMNLDKCWINANKNYTYRALLTALDYIYEDFYIVKIVNSDKANEEVYRKVFEIKAGPRSLQAVNDRTTDENLKSETQKLLSERKDDEYGLVYDINHETDEKKLEKLVAKYFFKYANVDDETIDFSNCSEIENKKAIEMLSKTSNQKILHVIIKNKYAPEKTVLSILKKNPSNENLYLSSQRTEKNILMYVCCMTHSDYDIERIFKQNPELFDVDEIITMIKWNATCKFTILKWNLLKFDAERLLSLKKLNDKDMNWIIDNALKKENNVLEEKAGRVIDRILKASRIVRNITLYDFD